VSVVQMVLPLIGVVVGALGSFLASSAGERTRWRREQQARWNARRVEAYAEYGHVVKRVYVLCKQLVEKSPYLTEGAAEPADGIPELRRLSAERASKWETVLLLGDARTIAAAREWHRAVWEMERIAFGKPANEEEWHRAFTAAILARIRFHEAARHDLGISDDRLPSGLDDQGEYRYLEGPGGGGVSTRPRSA